MRTGAGKLRVAAYIRVSTDHENQEDSYELQERHFRKLLDGNADWISAGIYSDYAISGTSKESRIGFTRLLRHCREGRIDHIVTKSISRFARNTKDFLEALDVLEHEGVTIYFERENMDTNEQMNRFVLTAFGAIAQEESRSISENVRWSIQKNYAEGRAKNVAVYGYRYLNEEEYSKKSEGDGRQVRAVEDEASVVRWIFDEAETGKTYIQIARKLNRNLVPSPETEKNRTVEGWNRVCGIKNENLTGCSMDRGWTPQKVRSILHLERYAGDVLLQKKYKEHFLSEKVLRNNGELPMYLVQNHHEPIVSREQFDSVQEMLSCKQIRGRCGDTRVRYPLSGVLICSHCGEFYHTRNRKGRPIWYCPSSQLHHGIVLCRAKKLYEQQLAQTIQMAVVEHFCLESNLKSGGKREYAGRLRAKLEYVQREDYMEQEREFYNRKQKALQKEKERLSELFLWLCEKEELTDERESLEEKLLENQKCLEDEAERRKHREQYWKELEARFFEREAAILWMKTLEAGENGAREFLRGVSEEYLKAFILSITVHSEERCAIHWFDDSVSMHFVCKMQIVTIT